MAKQSGPHFITGTVEGICFYRMNGRYYARRKSSLSRKRVKKDPAFAMTRMYAGLMGQASRIAAAVYRSLPRKQRKHALYRALTGKAFQALKEGLDEAVVRERLMPGTVKVSDVAPRRKPVVVLPGGGGVVRMVWQRGRKVVVECAEKRKAEVVRPVTWKVICGGEVREVEVRRVYG
jgi:hypothetical protein